MSNKLEAGPSILKAPKTQIGRGTVDVVTPQVAGALDRTNISDRMVLHYEIKTIYIYIYIYILFLFHNSTLDSYI